MNKYKIAEISIELKEDGTPMYWVYCAGYHAGQGGMEFVYGNFGTPSLEQSLEILKTRLMRDIDIILERVREKEDETI